MEYFYVIVPLVVVIIVFLLAKKLYKSYYWNIKRIDKLNGVQFENFVERIYNLKGYKSFKTKTTGDQGIDIILKRLNTKYGIQVKRYSNTVGNKAVQEAFAGKNYYNLDFVAVVTNSYFTKSAKDLALKNGVELIDRDDLINLINEVKNK